MEDEEIAWGKPTLEEYKEYFATPCLSIDEREVMEGEPSAGSIDLSDSFKSLLDQRRREFENDQPRTPVTSKQTHLLDETWTPFVGRLQDSVLEKSDWEPSDETFARMEAMCEDTQETAALERLLDEVPEETGKPTKFPVDMTQIHDIEAPSLMWEQTIMHANSPKASPVKMVGMLRPSTIVEESTVNETNDTADTIKEKTDESSESVVTIDSTGESFVTAHAGNASLDSVTSVDNIPKIHRKFFRDSLFPAAVVKKENSENFLDSLDVVEISDTSSSFHDESNDENSPQFNDTLERMDFLLAQAEKVAAQKEPVEPMKQVNTKVATPTSTFKKPSRVPLPKSTGKPKFNYIVSPIQQYIRNTPQNPVITRHHSLRDPRLIDEIDDRKLRQTQFFSKPPNKQETELPQLATVAASSRQMYDARTPQKVPGGDKIKGLIGKSTPTVVKHEGRLKIHEKGAKLNAANNTIDNSFADLSLMSGDVSVRVVKDVKRL